MLFSTLPDGTLR